MRRYDVAAQTDRQSRMVAFEEAGVRDDHEVAGQSLAVGEQPGLEVGRARFLLALEDVADVDGQPARGLQPRSRSPEVEMDLALVVGGATPEDAAALDTWIEGRPCPLLERIRGLDVVVAVDDDGRGPGGVQPVGVDERVATGLGDIDVLEADGTHARGEPFGAGTHVPMVLAEHADGGDAQEVEQLVEALSGSAAEVRVDLVDGVGHGSSVGARSRPRRVVRSG